MKRFFLCLAAAVTLTATAQTQNQSYVFLCLGDAPTLNQRKTEPTHIARQNLRQLDLQSGQWVEGNRDGKVSLTDYVGYAILRATGSEASVGMVTVPVKKSSLAGFVKGTPGYKRLLSLATTALSQGQLRGILYQPGADESVSQTTADALRDSLLQDLKADKTMCPIIIGEPLHGQDLNVAGARYGQELAQKAGLNHDTVTRTLETVTTETLTVNATLDDKGDMHATADKPMAKWEVRNAQGEVVDSKALANATETIVPLGTYDERITVVFFGVSGAEYSFTIE